jgi:exodeoxyribonuclease-3
VGWRIDLVLASPAAMRFAKRAFILPRVKGSDHCPIGVDFDAKILG